VVRTARTRSATRLEAVRVAKHVIIPCPGKNAPTGPPLMVVSTSFTSIKLAIDYFLQGVASGMGGKPSVGPV